MRSSVLFLANENDDRIGVVNASFFAMRPNAHAVHAQVIDEQLANFVRIAGVGK